MEKILIKNGIILTMDPSQRIIENGAIAIEDNKIVALAKQKM